MKRLVVARAATDRTVRIAAGSGTGLIHRVAWRTPSDDLPQAFGIQSSKVPVPRYVSLHLQGP